MKPDRLLNFCVVSVLAVLGIAYSNAAAEDVLDYNNVVIVLDASGSMNSYMSGTRTQKMDAAKDGLREVLKHVPKHTQIGLLVFSASNTSSDWVYPLAPRNDTRLKAAINLPRPGGSTPLGKYIKIGADRLLKQRTKQMGYGTYRLLVVTDGEADYGDRPLIEKYVPDIISRGITIDVIGVDMKSKHTLATQVHSYRSANDPESLKRAVADVFAEVDGKASDSSIELAFDQLDAIPDELAAAMLKALSSSGNHEIGTARKKIKSKTLAAFAQKVNENYDASRDKGSKSKKSGSKLYIYGFIVFGLYVAFSLFAKQKA